jgi:predicted RNase H-like HicB family nuclease
MAVLIYFGGWVYNINMENFRFSIVAEQDKDGYFVFCPELQGCYSQGETYEEALENIKDAIRLHLADRVSVGEKIPQSQSISLSAVEVAI